MHRDTVIRVLQIEPRDSERQNTQNDIQNEWQLPPDLAQDQVRPNFATIIAPTSRVDTAAPNLPLQIQHSINNWTSNFQQGQHGRFLTLQPSLRHAKVRGQRRHRGARPNLLHAR